jgi:hypothetical protein
MKTVTELAQQIADQELEACVQWISEQDWTWTSSQLRAARRPKQPSLKEQALDSWERLRNEAWCHDVDLDLDLIRRALEAMPND